MMSLAAAPLPLPDMLRVIVRDRAELAPALTFDIVENAPAEWLRAAALLANGQGEPGADGSLDRVTIRQLFARRRWTAHGWESGWTSDDPVDRTIRLGSHLEVELVSTRPASVAEQAVRVLPSRVDMRVAEYDPPWFDAPAPFRAEHLQHELEPAYGYVLPHVDRCGVPFAGPLVPGAALRAPALGRRARAHRAARPSR